MAETSTQTNETTTQRRKRNSPDAVKFAEVWNASDSRNDAVTRFKNAGYDMTYSALVAREKSYRKANIHLKVIPAAAKGRRLDVAAVNAQIDAASKQTA